MKENGLGLRWNQIVGVPSEEGNSWSQVRFEVRQKGEERVALMVMLSLSSDEEVRDKGRAMMEAIVLSFDQTKEVGMEFIQREVTLMKEELRGIGEGLIGVVIAGKDDKRSIYIGGEGGIRVELIREGVEKEIWRGGQPLSGWLRQEDKVVVGTRDFFEKVWSRDEEIAGIRTRVGEMEDGGKVVGLVLEIDEVEKVEEVEIEEILEAGVSEEKSGVEDGGEVRKRWAISSGGGEMGKRWLLKLKRQLGLGQALKLKTESIEKRSWGLVVGIVFLVILVGSIVVGARKQVIGKEREEFLAVVEPIEYTLGEADQIKEINAVRARNLVLEAREKVENQGERFNGGRNEEEWQELVRKVESAWKEMSGEVVVTGERWLDLGIFKSGVVVERINVGERLLALSRQSRVVIEVDLSDKSGEVVVGGEIMSGVEEIAEIRDGMGLLKEEVITMVNEEGEEIAELELEGVEGKVIKGFGRNVYLLANEDFFRYAATAEAWGRRTRFLQAGEEIESEEAVDVAIDGEVFVLMGTGEVVRLNQGTKVEYELKPVEEWKEPVRVMVSEEMGRIWVWDRKLGVVEFERETGNYLRKLMWDQFGEMSDVGVDEVNKRILGVKGSEIWVVGL